MQEPPLSRTTPALTSSARFRIPPAAKVPGLVVRAARVGQGVFATRPFRAGKAIAPVQGTLIPGADYEGSDTAIDLQEDGTLEPAPPFCYLNHSCEPNCELVLFEEVDDDDQVVARGLQLETLRYVATGDELTIDYGWTAEAAIPCQCGSRRCRHWVAAESELSRLNGE